MPIEEPESMKELHQIRNEQYENTKNLTREKEFEYFAEKASRLKALYDINLKTLINK